MGVSWMACSVSPLSPTPAVSHSAGLGWNLRVCISNKCPGALRFPREIEPIVWPYTPRVYFKELAQMVMGLQSLTSAGRPVGVDVAVLKRNAAWNRALPPLGTSNFSLKLFKGLDEAHQVIEGNHVTQSLLI